METDPEQVDRENRYVLATIQAMLRLIAPAVRAVALQVGADDLRLRFWTDGDEAEVTEDADDVVFELEALLLPENPRISVEIIRGIPPVDFHKFAGRMIYWAKTPDSD